MLHARDDYNRIQDPMNKIPLLEPVFLLRGQDSFAACCVEHWAKLNEEQNGDPELTKSALLQANKMREWHIHKLPDCPTDR